MGSFMLTGSFRFRGSFVLMGSLRFKVSFRFNKASEDLYHLWSTCSDVQLAVSADTHSQHTQTHYNFCCGGEMSVCLRYRNDILRSFASEVINIINPTVAKKR